MRQTRRSISVVCGGGLMAMLFLTTFSGVVSADDVNMTHSPQAWFATGQCVTSYNNAKLYDFNYADMKSTYIHGYLKASDLYTRGFTAPDPDDYPYGVTYWPANDATIVAVWAVAILKTDNVSTTTIQFSYSVGINEAYFVSKGSSSPISLVAGEGQMYPAIVTWNVTSYETWTPTMLKSNSTWIKLHSEDNVATTIHVDYLGLFYWWTQPGGGGPGGGPKEDEPIDWDNATMPIIPWHVAFGGEELRGFLGAAAFVGMVGTPIIAMFLHRATDDPKALIFAKLAAFFAACFGLFSWSLTG